MSKHKELLTPPPRQAGLTRRLGSACLQGQDRTTGEADCCNEEGTLTRTFWTKTCFLCEDGTSSCRTYCPHLRNTMTWPFRKNTCESERFMDPINSSATASMTFGTQVVRTGTVCNVMAATRCAVVRIQACLLHATSSPGMDRVAEWFSLLERLIYHPSQRTFSLQLEEELEPEVWDSHKADSWALPSSERQQYCYEVQRNAFAFSEA